MFGMNRGIPTTCPNCNGRTRLNAKYGECDYCGSLLVAPIPVEEMPRPVPQKVSMNNDRINAHCARLVEVLSDIRRPMSVSEIVAFLDSDMTNQKCAVLLRKLVNDGVVERVEIRKKACFYIKGA